MTWGEFKTRVEEQGVRDGHLIIYIDCEGHDYEHGGPTACEQPAPERDPDKRQGWSIC